MVVGEFVNEDGETVIDEEEFLLLTQLKKLKQQYRCLLLDFIYNKDLLYISLVFQLSFGGYPILDSILFISE